MHSSSRSVCCRLVLLLRLTAGPYKINGVPLRRLNQAYVIATSTQVDVSKVDVAKIDDAFFVRKAAKKVAGKDGEGFFAKQEGKVSRAQTQRKPAQTFQSHSVPSGRNRSSWTRCCRGRGFITVADGAVRSSFPELLRQLESQGGMRGTVRCGAGPAVLRTFHEVPHSAP